MIKSKTSSGTTRKRNAQSVKNIKRIDSTKTHGWQVHVRRGGLLKTKLFSDRVYKGKRKALMAAKEYRDQILEEMAPLAKPLWKIDRRPKTNTGQLGASYTEYTNRSGEKRGVITVTVRESLGRPVNRKFSVNKLGYDEALRQAVEWRQDVLMERERKESKAEGRKAVPLKAPESVQVVSPVAPPKRSAKTKAAKPSAAKAAPAKAAPKAAPKETSKAKAAPAKSKSAANAKPATKVAKAKPAPEKAKPAAKTKAASKAKGKGKK